MEPADRITIVQTKKTLLRWRYFSLLLSLSMLVSTIINLPVLCQEYTGNRLLFVVACGTVNNDRTFQSHLEGFFAAILLRFGGGAVCVLALGVRDC